MSEKFEILLNFVKDLSSETPDAESYIFVKDNISFIPRNILNRCQVVSFKRPTKGEYIKATSKTTRTTFVLNFIFTP